jgi:hypothetical protein
MAYEGIDVFIGDFAGCMLVWLNHGGTPYGYELFRRHLCWLELWGTNIFRKQFVSQRQFHWKMSAYIFIMQANHVISRLHRCADINLSIQINSNALFEMQH